MDAGITRYEVALAFDVDAVAEFTADMVRNPGQAVLETSAHEVRVRGREVGYIADNQRENVEVDEFQVVVTAAPTDSEVRTFTHFDKVRFIDIGKMVVNLDGLVLPSKSFLKPLAKNIEDGRLLLPKVNLTLEPNNRGDKLKTKLLLERVGKRRDSAETRRIRRSPLYRASNFGSL